MDMHSRWVVAKDGDGLKPTTRDIVITLTTSVAGGADTTATALQAILYFLLKNPDKLAKVTGELDAADAAGKLGPMLSYRECQEHLPYYHAAAKEAMRLHPSVGLLLERHVPEGGANICGQFLPGGTVVGVNPWVVHHDPTVFPNPTAYEPERWLESSPERLAQMERSFFEFGAGSRMCVGMNVAMIEVCKVVPQLLREFAISFAQPEKEWVVRSGWFTRQEGLVCNLERRRLPL